MSGGADTAARRARRLKQPPWLAACGGAAAGQAAGRQDLRAGGAEARDVSSAAAVAAPGEGPRD